MLQNLYFIAGIVLAVPVAVSAVLAIRAKLRKHDPLAISRRKFADSRTDLARTFPTRFEFSQLIPTLIEGAHRQITFAAMGAGTMIDIRGRKHFAELVAQKVTQPGFENFTVVMWDPLSDTYQQRLLQLKEEDRASGLQNVTATLAFLADLDRRYEKFHIRVYRPMFQPTLLFLEIDAQYLWISPYLNEVYGKHSPLVLEFHEGGQVFLELLEQVRLLTADTYSQPFVSRV